MILEDLAELTAEKLEAITPEQLEAILSPHFPLTRPELAKRKKQETAVKTSKEYTADEKKKLQMLIDLGLDPSLIPNKKGKKK